MREGAIFTDVSSVVRYVSSYPYLADHVVQQMFPNHEEKDEAQSLKSISREVLEGLTLGHLVPAAFHSAAVTAAKVCGYGVNDDATIVPPRFPLDEITGGRSINKSYGKKMEETNLKPVMTRSGHPWYLGDEPNVVIAAEFTNSYDPKLGQLNEELSWKYRSSPKYVLCQGAA